LIKNYSVSISGNATGFVCIFTILLTNWNITHVCFTKPLLYRNRCYRLANYYRGQLYQSTTEFQLGIATSGVGATVCVLLEVPFSTWTHSPIGWKFGSSTWNVLLWDSRTNSTVGTVLYTPVC